MKWGDIRTRVRGNLTAMVWKDKKNVNMLTNIHHPTAESNVCDEHGNTLKPAVVQDHNKHMEYVDKSDHMTNIPSADGPGRGQRNCSFTHWT
jgi:hypothetical protein